MKKYIALLRGINVGGHNKLPMKELRSLLEEFDLQNVKTYIQSGNVTFESKAISPSEFPAELGNAINQKFGFTPRIMILERNTLNKIINANPFPDAEAKPKSLHIYFLDRKPSEPDLTTLEDIKKESEHFDLQNQAFYLHAPEGVGRSKLAAHVEKALGVKATARNWRTVNKIREMISE